LDDRQNSSGMFPLNNEAMAKISEAVDRLEHDSAGHASRLSAYSVATAKAIGLSESDIDALRSAAKLHDVGKISISDDILHKTDPLTNEESAMIQTHASTGAQYLDSFDIPNDAKRAVRHHHERYDGSGYPEGLSDRSIPILARILSIADAFDAMTNDRPYRQAMTIGEAAQRLIHGAGAQFDPEIVRVFVALLRGELEESEIDASYST